jgi:hypothetical protein
MAKQAVRRAAKATPDAVKAKGPAIADKEGRATALAVVMPNAKALSLDAGMTALKYVAALSDDERQVEELQEGIASNRYAAMTTLALAIYNAGKNDAGIQLADTFSDDKAAKNKVGKQIRLALGLAKIYPRANKQEVDWTPEAAALMMAAEGDDAKTLARKESIRTNFSTMMTKCARVALNALENNLKVEVDKQERTLRLSGPAILKHFGDTSVALNEDQNQLKDKKGQIIGKLNARPSFTEIAKLAAADHGKAMVSRKDSRKQTVDPMKHLIGLCNDLKAAIEKTPADLPEDVMKALQAVRNAVDTKL